MTNLNDHISARKLDIYAKDKYGIASYDEAVKFHKWVEQQVIQFDNTVHALKVYRGEEVSSPKPNHPEDKPKRTEKSFKSRQQVNSYLRRNGYKWYKLASMGEREESEFGECGRWALMDDDNNEYSVKEALARI